MIQSEIKKAMIDLVKGRADSRDLVYSWAYRDAFRDLWTILYPRSQMIELDPEERDDRA